MYRGSFRIYKCTYASVNFFALDFYICFNLIPYYIMVIYRAVVGTIHPYITYNMLVFREVVPLMMQTLSLYKM